MCDGDDSDGPTWVLFIKKKTTPAILLRCLFPTTLRFLILVFDNADGDLILPNSGLILLTLLNGEELTSSF